MPATETPLPSPSSSSSSSSSSSTTKRKPWIFTGMTVGLVVILGLGIGGFFFFNGDSKSEDKGGNKENTNSTVNNAPNAMMDSVRNSDPCAMQDASAISRYGPHTDVSVFIHLSSCTARAYSLTADNKIDQTQPITTFDLALGEAYPAADRDMDIAETVGNHQVFRETSPHLTDVNTCYYYLPLTDSEFTATIRTHRFIPNQKNALEWPERCAAAKEYLGVIADKILALAPAKKLPTQPVLRAKDPCHAQDEIVKQLPGWALDPVHSAYSQGSPYSCSLTLTNPDEPSYEFHLQILFVKDAEPTDGEDILIGGFRGKRSKSGTVTLVFQPAVPQLSDSAANILIRLKASPKENAEEPIVPSELTDKIALAVANGAK